MKTAQELQAPPQLRGAADLLSLVDREVWIVTARAPDGRRGGCVATWISSISIDPQHPAILAGIAPNHFTAELIDAAGSFAAHLISAEQVSLAWRFGLTSGRDEDKFDQLLSGLTAGGAPRLTQSLGWIDCRVFHRYQAGDRIFYWADVVGGERTEHPAQPLREQELFARAAPEQLRALRDSINRDLASLRPLAQQWREQCAVPRPAHENSTKAPFVDPSKNPQLE